MARCVGSRVAHCHHNLFMGGTCRYLPTADLHQRAPLIVGPAALVRELPAVAAR